MFGLLHRSFETINTRMINRFYHLSTLFIVDENVFFILDMVGDADNVIQF